MSAATIESVGYEGWPVQELVDDLRRRGIEVLVDVRLNAISRRPGFSKAALTAALAGAGIDYLHLRQLGNPKANRAGFGSRDPAPARETYRALLQAPAAAAQLDQLHQLAHTRRVAVLCFEANESQCHRQVLLDELGRRYGGRGRSVTEI